MKWILIIIIIGLCIPFVNGLDLCSEDIPYQMTCSFITPQLNCTTYNYTIYNSTGVVLSNGNLTPFYDSVYYLNFSEIEGEYVISLCDGTNRTVMVGQEGDNMIVAALILIPLLLMFVFLKWSEQLGEAHSGVKVFFQLLIIPLGFLTVQFGVLAISKFFNWTPMIDALADLGWYIGLIGMALGVYILIFIFYRVVKNFGKDKEILYDDEEEE